MIRYTVCVPTILPDEVMIEFSSINRQQERYPSCAANSLNVRERERMRARERE